MKPNAIAIAVDAGFFPPAAFLATRLAQLNPRDDTEIVIVSDSREDLARAKEFGVPARMIQFNPPPGLPAKNRITQAAYYRLFLPAILGPSTARVLYLDADIHAESGRLFGLFDLDMHGHAIAAVRDRWLIAQEHPRYQRAVRAAGVATSRKYLNSGVLLIDCDVYKAQKIAFRALSLGFVDDQSALNITLRGDWCEMSAAMNMTYLEALSELGRVQPPVIVHYAGPVKLWNLPDDARFTAFVAYLQSSPWPTFMEARKVFRVRSGQPLTLALRRFVESDIFADVSQGITPRPKALAVTPAVRREY